MLKIKLFVNIVEIDNEPYLRIFFHTKDKELIKQIVQELIENKTVKVEGILQVKDFLKFIASLKQHGLL